MAVLVILVVGPSRRVFSSGFKIQRLFGRLCVADTLMSISLSTTHLLITYSVPR